MLVDLRLVTEDACAGLHQDAAVLCVANTGALLPQRFQLLIQLAQLADAAGDLANVLIEQRVDLATLGLRIVLETQHGDGKAPDLSKAAAKVTPLTGTEKQEVEPKPAGDKLEATGSFKVGPGTKAVSVVTIARPATERFAMKYHCQRLRLVPRPAAR